MSYDEEVAWQMHNIKALIETYKRSDRMPPDAILTVFEVAAVLGIKLDLYGESVPESHKA